MGRCRPNSSAQWFRCECPLCGRAFLVSASQIGRTKRCFSCYQENIVGRKFGQLTVIERIGSINGHSYWKCQCDCGQYINVQGGNLKSGGVKSCGCLLRNNPSRITAVRNAIKNKLRKVVSSNFVYDDVLIAHPSFGCWIAMIERCTNPKNNQYHNYGGRGIKVCSRWLPDNYGFENFVKDMGVRPNKDYSIDRIDHNGDYCPENCRWATMKIQQNNRRNNVCVVVRGKELTMTQFCELSGLSRSVLYKPFKDGVDINFIVLNSNRYRTGKRKRHNGHINHNRVVSEEVIKLLENINTNSDEQNN